MSSSEQKKIRVLIVDDSAVVRNILGRELAADSEIEVIGSAPDPYIARDKIVQLQPDVVTLDVEMPKMDGITFLKKLMHYYPIPVIVISSVAAQGSKAALEAIEAGAVDVMVKPGGSACSIAELYIQLVDKIKAAAKVKFKQTLNQTQTRKIPRPREYPSIIKTSGKIVAIGASTGGTQAIQRILTEMPENSPPIIIVQHMPEHFTKSFAERLDSICKIGVSEALDGDILRPGHALIAAGNTHMILKKRSSEYYVQVKDGPLVNRHRPSVDVLFKSTAAVAGADAIGVILTGMGADGADGIKLMHDAGSQTIAQNEETCVVYGMPKESVARGGIDCILPLDNIAGKIIELVRV